MTREGAGVDDQPTGPLPRVVPRRRRRRPWRAAALVVVTLAVVAGAAAGGWHLLSTAESILPGHGGSSASGAVDDGLLPGAPHPTVPPPAAPATVSGVGYDVSYPQCGRTLPSPAAFGIVGLNGGAPLTTNRCLSEQMAWARRTGAYALYVNTAYRGVGDPVAYGRRLAEDAIAREHAAGVRGVGMWWLDVELTNDWRGTQHENATVLASMIVRLQEAGVRVGIYSSPDQWAEIAGDWSPGLPVWNAVGLSSPATALASCEESFAGSSSALVQWVAKRGSRLLDHNLVCPAFRHRAGDLLVVRR